MKRYICIILMLMLSFTGCGDDDSNVSEIIGTDSMNVEYYTASFVIDENDLEQVTTYASYVFVGTVEEYIKTEYLNDENDSPLTYYSVKVVDNIKGELTQSENVVLKKAGGKAGDSNTYYLCSGDILPAVGNTYIFASVIFEDDLYCPCPNMVALIDSVDNYKTSDIYNKYVEACKHESDVVENGETNVSKYDVCNY